MKFELNEYRKNIADWELIEDIIVVSKKLGKGTLTAKEYAQHGKYHRRTIRKRFGTWYAVLKRAGLEPLRAPRNMDEVNEEALFENLMAVWMKLGRQPRRKDMKSPLSRFGKAVYIKHFGGWMNALRKFVEYKNTEPVTGDEIENETVIAPLDEGFKEYKCVEKDSRHIPLRLKFSVFVRDGFTCVCCGKSPITQHGIILHCDHIIPWSKGGETTFENLRTLCEECNLGKGDRMEILESGKVGIAVA
jgi:hypothetical protein